MQKVLSGRRVMICREIPVIPSGVKTKGKTTMNIGKLMTAMGQLVDDLENLLVDLQCDNVDRPSNDSDAEMDTRDAVTRELRTIYNRFEAKVCQAVNLLVYLLLHLVKLRCLQCGINLKRQRHGCIIQFLGTDIYRTRTLANLHPIFAK